VPTASGSEGKKSSSTSASSCPQLRFAKGISKRDEKDAKRQTHRVTRKQFRVRMIQRDQSACRACGKNVYDATPHVFALAHVHELVAKSQGGSDLDSMNCLTLCPECHEKVTRNTLWLIVETPQLGANGVVTVSTFKDGPMAARDRGVKRSTRTLKRVKKTTRKGETNG
jgi:hypothetical protein